MRRPGLGEAGRDLARAWRARTAERASCGNGRLPQQRAVAGGGERRFPLQVCFIHDSGCQVEPADPVREASKMQFEQKTPHLEKVKRPGA